LVTNGIVIKEYRTININRANTFIMRELKIGFLQQHNVEDIKNNIERLAEGITNLAQRGAELVILQELHNSLYFCQTEDVNKFDLAETIPGPSTGFYGELARELGIVIVTSLFEKRAPGLYHNTAVVIEKDGSIAGKYRKMHIPDDPAYYEKFYFTPGDLGFHPIDTSVGRLGVLVCWDQWYPEAARLWPCKVQICLSIQQLSATRVVIRTRKNSVSVKLGQQSCVVMPLLMVCQ